MIRAAVLGAFLVPLIAAADPGAKPHVGQVSPVIYLERCKNGCVLHKGIDDAKTLTSGIVDGNGTDFPMPEFTSSTRQTGAAADAEWNALVKCVKEVYSPYAAMVTDVKPTIGSYQVVVVAGAPTDINYSTNAAGVAFVHCNPLDNSVSFVFADYFSGAPSRRTLELCGAVAQETAHTYGLSHVYKYADGRSACTDPMTYRSDCGGQQFFRNESAFCGGFAQMQCTCGATTQNSHLSLLGVFGPGTPITTPPTVTLTQPQPGSTLTSTSAAVATAFAQRGIANMELWLNGYKWANVKGAAFGANGQPESTYSLPIPADVPDGIIDIVVKAKDDIEVTTASASVTVTKGVPCTSADTCAVGQRCDAGRCLWDPPVGRFGDACTYQQFCAEGVCGGITDDEKICTQECVAGVADACPDAAYECVQTKASTGICLPKGAADPTCGCASAGSAAVPFAMCSFGLAFVLRRRRR